MNTSRLAKRSVLRAVACGVVLGMTACAPDDQDVDQTDSPIVGGNPAGGVGVVGFTIWDGVNDNVAYCSGTVIANNRIITAGHCFDPWLTIRDGRDVTYLLEGDGLLARVNYTDDGANWTCLTHPTDAVCQNHDEAYASIHVSRLGAATSQDIAVMRFTSPLQRIRRSAFRQVSTHELRVKQSIEEWGAGKIDTAGMNGGLTSTAMRRAVVRITEVKATTFRTTNSSSTTCDGDSGGPGFAGPSDSIAGIYHGSPGPGVCGPFGSTSGWSRITPAVVTFIDNHRQGADPACRETIAGTGYYACY